MTLAVAEALNPNKPNLWPSACGDSLGPSVAKWDSALLSGYLRSPGLTPLRPGFGTGTGHGPYVCVKVSSVTFAVGWWFRPGYSSAQDQWNWHFIITISPPIDMTLAGKKARRKEDAQSDQTNKYTNIIYTMTRVKGEIRTRCNHFYMGCRKLFVCFLFHVHFAGRSPVHSSILDLEGPPPPPRQTDRQTYRQTDRQTDRDRRRDRGGRGRELERGM